MASFNHAHYLVKNSYLHNETTIGHFEDRTRQFFTGNAPGDRAVFAGFPLSVSEAYTANAASFTSNLPVYYVASEALGVSKQRELMESIYHGRGAFGAGRSIGFGSEIGCQASTQVGFNIAQFRMVNEISNETNTQKLGTNAVATFPCQGATVSGSFYPAIETPNPFPAVTSATVAYGTPIYFKADAGAVVVVTTGTVTKVSDGSVVTLVRVNASNDVATAGTFDHLLPNEVFLVPTSALTKGAAYTVHAVGTVNGVAFTRDFTFAVAS